MSNKDKRKKMLKRLSKIRRLERKDKKKKRTKNRSSSRNSLYQEYAYQQKSRRSSYLLFLFIVLLLTTVSIIVYFALIKPKLNNKTEDKPKCTKNKDEDCQYNEYLDKEKCECLPCIAPSCNKGYWYKPYNGCDNSNKNPKEFKCLPCPTCPAGKNPDINNPCGGTRSTYCIDIPSPPPSSNNKKSGSLTPGAITGIVIGIIFIICLVIFLSKKKKKVSALVNNPKKTEMMNITNFADRYKTFTDKKNNI